MTNETWIKAFDDPDAIWMIVMHFKDTEDDTNCEQSFFLTGADALSFWEEFNHKYEIAMYRVDDPYINTFEDMKRSY